MREVSLFSSTQKPACGEERLTISVLRQHYPKSLEKKYKQTGFQLIISNSVNPVQNFCSEAKVKDGKRKKWAEGLLSQNGRYEMKEVKSI